MRNGGIALAAMIAVSTAATGHALSAEPASAQGDPFPAVSLQAAYGLESFDSTPALASKTTDVEPSGSDASADLPWQFTVTPYLWMLNLKGDATVGGNSSDVDVNFGTILEQLDIAAMIEGEVRYDRFGVFANYLYGDLTFGETFQRTFRPIVQVLTGQTGTNFKVDTSVQLDILSVGAFYRVGEYSLGKPRPRYDGPGPSVAIEPYAGARYTDVIIKVDFLEGPTFKGSESWVDPIVGVRTFWTYDDRWNGVVLADVGGFGVGSDISWRVFGGVGYRFGLFDERDANLLVGYKALYQDYSTGSGANAFAWKMLIHGPIAGLEVRF